MQIRVKKTDVIVESVEIAEKETEWLSTSIGTTVVSPTYNANKASTSNSRNNPAVNGS